MGLGIIVTMLLKGFDQPSLYLLSSSPPLLSSVGPLLYSLHPLIEKELLNHNHLALRVLKTSQL
ncbi:hypothetical protein LSO9J_110045 [Candidatus Liberibacter solanacearum]